MTPTMPWLHILIGIATLLNSMLLAIQFFSMRSMVARREHQRLTERVTRLEERDTPGWPMVNELRGAIGTLGGDVKRLDARIEGLQSLLKRTEGALETLERHILKVEG
ncbi:MAG: hypothetical protein WA005_02045 [Candidatus Binataceae bacterium]